MNFSKTSKGTSAQAFPQSFDGEILVDPFIVLPKNQTVKDAAAVTELHLSGRAMTAIPPRAFAPFSQLLTLWLSDNNLRCLSNLSGCERLRTLHVARNKLRSLSPGEGCELIDTAQSLIELDLSGNPLTNLDALLDELSFLPFLRTLSLAGSPASSEADYRARALARLPTLTTLDFRTVTAAERTAAEHAYGDTARGAARVAAERSAKAALLHSARTEHEASKTARVASPRSLSSTTLTVRPDGIVDYGNESGRLGLGRGAIPAPPATTVFGQGWNVKTTTRRALEAEAAAILKRRHDDSKREAEKQFEALAATAQPGAQWSMTIDHSSLLGTAQAPFSAAGSPAVGAKSPRPEFAATDTMQKPMSRVETTRGGPLPGASVRAFSPRSFPHARRALSDATLASSAAQPAPFVAPPITTSALINSTQASGCEDLFVRRLREEMAARGVPHELLTADTKARLDALGGADVTSALLTALAPATPAITGTAMLVPEASAAQRQGGVRGSPMRLDKTFSATSRLGASYPALADTLAAAGARTGLAAMAANDPIALQAAMLAKTGTRLTLQRRPAETMARFGLTASGAKDFRRTDAVERALGRAADSSADGGPLLPSLTPDGALGAWDTFRLLTIFKMADADGSGELSMDEIRRCLTDAADFGFCVASNELEPPVMGQKVEGVSRAATPAGGAASTAFLGTVSSRGKASALGAARKVNALVESVFSAVDIDGSGTVSWKEFSDALEGRKPRGAAPDAPPPPRIRFRPLSAVECSARAQRHFKSAEGALSLLNSILEAALPAVVTDPATAPAVAAAARAAHEAWQREASAVARNDGHIAAVKGARLMALAKALAGAYDPAEAPPAPPPPRHDFFPLRSVAPATAVKALAAAHGAAARARAAILLPGDEIDEDERAVMRVLHPSALEVEEEDEDAEAGGVLQRDRRELSGALVKTLRSAKWQNHRGMQKASAPRSLHQTTNYF